MNTEALEIKQLPTNYDDLAPDGSEIRVLFRLKGGSTAHSTLPPGKVSLAHKHRTIEEIWYFISGQGQVWRKLDGEESEVDVSAGSCLTIPLGAHFQFRNTGQEPLCFVITTMPPWPGALEAVRVPDHWPVMITRKRDSHVVKQSPTCGAIHEILKTGDYPYLTIAVVHNIGPTKAHFHSGIDEVYFVLDGHLLLKTYDPRTDKVEQIHLNANELCMIPKGVHHVIVESSSVNRLCAVSIPPFDAADEHPSDRL